MPCASSHARAFFTVSQFGMPWTIMLIILCSPSCVETVGEGEAVEDRGGLVTHFQHDPPKLTLLLRQAILAGLMRETAGAGHQRERSIGQAQDIAIAYVDGRQRQPIAAIAPALRGDQPGPR